MFQCVPPADIRLLFLTHCSLCAQQEATKSAQTRTVGPLMMTQLITLLTTTTFAVCCPLKGPGTVSPPGLSLAWSPISLFSAYSWPFLLPWQELKPHPFVFQSSSDPGPMRTDPGASAMGRHRVSIHQR